MVKLNEDEKQKIMKIVNELDEIIFNEKWESLEDLRIKLKKKVKEKLSNR